MNIDIWCARRKLVYPSSCIAIQCTFLLRSTFLFFLSFPLHIHVCIQSRGFVRWSYDKFGSRPGLCITAIGFAFPLYQYIHACACAHANVNVKGKVDDNATSPRSGQWDQHQIRGGQERGLHARVAAFGKREEKQLEWDQQAR